MTGTKTTVREHEVELVVEAVDRLSAKLDTLRTLQREQITATRNSVQVTEVSIA